MVGFPFISTGATSRDEAGDARPISVGGREQDDSGREASGVLAHLIGEAGVNHGEVGGIGENADALVESHAVFGEVAGGLGGVLLELHV
jgi:hypothetical protein